MAKTKKKKATLTVAAVLMGLAVGGLVAAQWPEIQREMKMMRM